MERTHPTTRPEGTAISPTDAWALLAAGNARFRADAGTHPGTDARARSRLALGQRPLAVFFGCADSRVASIVIFDQGLGDLFVVRTAGHVLDPAVLGSLEFGVGVLGCPLVVVLGHDSCGAVKAAEEAVRTGDLPGGHLREIIERVTPSVLMAAGSGPATTEDIERIHIIRTCSLIAERSALIDRRVEDGRLAIVGGYYGLAVGEVQVVATLGDVDTGRDR